eukprot:1665240-Rhodomonas_salina.3
MSTGRHLQRGCVGLDMTSVACVCVCVCVLPGKDNAAAPRSMEWPPGESALMSRASECLGHASNQLPTRKQSTGF